MIGDHKKPICRDHILFSRFFLFHFFGFIITAIRKEVKSKERFFFVDKRMQKKRKTNGPHIFLYVMICEVIDNVHITSLNLVVALL